MKYTSCAMLVQDLLAAKRDLRLSKEIKKLARYDGLIIDEMGYVQQSREEMEVLFTLLAERYERGSALGAAPSPPDGRYLYYAAKTGLGFDDGNTFPLWHIVRLNLNTGEEDSIVHAQGSAFRPQVSPDGKSLVYATRFQGMTGLRVRSLVTDEDHWLLYPVQRDDQEASASRDLLPRYAFTPDSRSILINFGGLIHGYDIAHTY
jgi:hypothetical protein